MARRPSTFGPTQKEIGEALGIAQTTVALALNPKYSGRYAPETVERVRKKAEEMGYRPRKFAQMMRCNRSYVIGVLGHTGAHESSRSKLVEMINALRERGFSTVVADVTWFNNSPQEALAYLLDHSIEGLVCLNLSGEVEMGMVSARGLPVVEVNCNVSFGYPQVQEEIEQIYVELTRHHLKNGARRLVLLLNQRDAPLAAPLKAYTVVDRVSGFARAIEAVSGRIEVDFVSGAVDALLPSFGQKKKPRGRQPQVVGHIVGPASRKGWRNSYDVGHGVALEMLQAPQPPDAFVCANDDIAIGVLKACRELGVAVPGQVLVSGYDASIVSEYAATALTTVRAGNREIAQKASDLIIEAIQSGKQRKKPVCIHVQGVALFRESSAAPAATPAVPPAPAARLKRKG